MKLIKNITVKHLLGCRSYAKQYPYVPWKNLEVLQSIEDELAQPPRKVTPENPVKRTSISNPAHHTYNDVGKFYTVPEADLKHYFQIGGLRKKFTELCKAFNETCIMIRSPFLEIRDYMVRADYSQLPIKYVLYGADGCGKSLTLFHLLHYALLQEFVVFQVPNAPYIHQWGKKEANRSEKRSGLIDLPLEGALLLKNFQLQNAALLDKLKITTAKDYEWNLRESTPAGSPLTSIVSHGINRVKYSCDCIDVLIDELKIAATAGRCKVLFVVGGFNSFYAPKTMIRIDEKYGIKAEDLSLIQSFFKFLKPDWCNGAILLTVSERATTPENRGSFLPTFLLKKKGFEDVDPFIPVHVPELNDLEFHSLLDYYEDRRWLQKPGGREEIQFISSRIANHIRNYCAPL